MERNVPWERACTHLGILQREKLCCLHAAAVQQPHALSHRPAAVQKHEGPSWGAHGTACRARVNS